MDMQREDFLKLCKLPEMFYYPTNPYARGKAYPTRSGRGSANVARVIKDWFPHGAIVSVEGSNFISRGVESVDPIGRLGLCLLDAKTLKTHRFSIFEALSLAELSIKDSSDAQA